MLVMYKDSDGNIKIEQRMSGGMMGALAILLLFAMMLILAGLSRSEEPKKAPDVIEAEVLDE